LGETYFPSYYWPPGLVFELFGIRTLSSDPPLLISGARVADFFLLLEELEECEDLLMEECEDLLMEECDDCVGSTDETKTEF
jgi:hypothetical protein